MAFVTDGGGEVSLALSAETIVTETAAREGTTIIGETMTRVEIEATKIPGAKILNDMPPEIFMGTEDQITSNMMSYNRKWLLNQMRTSETIVDLGMDINRAPANRSIFYEMEQNMIKNYQILHPGSLNIIKP